MHWLHEDECSIRLADFEIQDVDFNCLELLVKAHEKEIYDYGDYIIARTHHDNDGDYPFSKLDFLTHKLQELIYPDNVPKIYAGYFGEDTYYVLEKVVLDPRHKAYNISRQQVHKNEGLDYDYSDKFLDTPKDDVERLMKEHYEMVLNMQKKHAHNLTTYGITFDHSHVNITWKDHLPVALEVHKCQRSYLFDRVTCREYITNKMVINRDKALYLIDRIDELWDKRVVEL